MDHRTFENHINSLINKCKEVLTDKQDQYADEDCFHNFVQGSLIAGEEKERILFLYMLKHLVFVRDFFNNTKEITGEDVPKIQESIGDIIIYFMILSAMLKERYE